MAKKNSSNRHNIFSEYNVDKVEAFDWWFWDNLDAYAAIQQCIASYGKTATKKFSLRTILEILRTGLDLRYREIELKLNNDWVPMLQRKLEEDRPDLMQFLTSTRNTHTKKKKKTNNTD